MSRYYHLENIPKDSRDWDPSIRRARHQAVLNGIMQLALNACAVMIGVLVVMVVLHCHRTLEEKIKIRTAELEAEITARKLIEEALRERVKELHCIYSITDLIEKTDHVDEIFQGTTDLIVNGLFKVSHFRS